MRKVIKILEPGYRFEIPYYTVVEGKGIEFIEYVPLEIVRGSSNDKENRLEKIDGVILQDLLGVCIEYMKNHANAGKLTDGNSEKAFYYIKEALNCLNKRESDRRERGVLGTYKK